MEKSILNQKAWYRALKVIFVLAFSLAQIIGFVITNTIASDKISFVHCDNGKEFENQYFLPDDKEKLDLFKKCGITDYFLSKTGVEGIITDEQKKQLSSEIVRMQEKGVLESEMQLAVDNFKQKYADRTPANNTTKSYTVEELSKIYGHDFNDSFKVEGSDNYWVANFTFNDRNKYSTIQKLGFYVISFVLISLLFWIISKVFFYIFCGERFFSLKFHDR